jgi:5-methyltetrahydrofolate--homocysteine methyltransferase
MTGLDLMNQLCDPVKREDIVRNNTISGNGSAGAAITITAVDATDERSAKVRRDIPIPEVAYLDRKIRQIQNLREIWSYINPFMLYGRHMGFKGDFEKSLAQRDPKALELYSQMEEIKTAASEFMKVRAVWQFFEAEPEGNRMHLFAPGAGKPLHTFHFQRQRTGDKLCLSDYILPRADGKRDHLALFVVTAGEGMRERAEEAKAAGFYFRSHALQSLALETAEGCAEWLHRRLREDWGFADPEGMTMPQRFTSRYRGKRYSFGYPACPNLEDQAGIWKLLRPEEIGVQLTEGMMMDPVASVSALVFHHPDCTYFSVGDAA